MTRFQILIVALLLLAGTLYRLWPIAAGMPDLANFFLTEDGYLMLTIARNIAIGLGMSVAEGTIQTNGVQPLATYLFTLPYLATGGDKTASLVGIHLIHAATALGGAFAIRALAARLLAPRDPAPVWPWAVALLWFLGPLLLRHSMNGLETSLYTLLILLTLLQFLRLLERDGAETAGDRLLLGALCGLTVLGRIDGAFLVTAIFLTWAFRVLLAEGFGRMLAKLVPPGLLSLAVAAPWLIYNQINFGSIMPISGTAQRLTAEGGTNLPLIPVKLFEHMLPMLPVPARMEGMAAVTALCAALVLGVLLAFLWRMARYGTIPARTVALAYVLHLAALGAFYGLAFGAPWFTGRYLAPLAPLLILAALSLALELDRRLGGRPMLAGLFAGGGLAVSAGFLILALLPGQTRQGHEQVVAWVTANVPEETWVGAPQTGTLGYWHDRTINLDGKVNPAALATLLREGHVLNYVVASPIDYIVDWVGMADWPEHAGAEDGFAEAFAVLVRDPVSNLAVLARRPR